MYIAELKGKLSSKTEEMEDILTSNVFSFFKYCDRKVFFQTYLNKVLKLNVSSQDAGSAEFIFWPRFEDKTEPDLVIIVGDYYLLIEAKLFSGFGTDPKHEKAQLVREIKGGISEAHNYKKKFYLLAITADHYYKADKFAAVPEKYVHHFKWTNWQSIAFFLFDTLESNIELSYNQKSFAEDLYNLLDKKKLRDFQGVKDFNHEMLLPEFKPIFFDAKTALYRGDFIGFTNLLSGRDIDQTKQSLFFNGRKRYFESLLNHGCLQDVQFNISEGGNEK